MNYTQKQVIVMRKLFPDSTGNLSKIRTGKYIAQGAHASLGCILDNFIKDGKLNTHGMDTWFTQGFAKIIVSVDTEKELLDLYNKIKDAGLPVKLIIDAGHTEFGNIPTVTCFAVGPCKSSEIDFYTGHLPLM